MLSHVWGCLDLFVWQTCHACRCSFLIFFAIIVAHKIAPNWNDHRLSPCLTTSEVQSSSCLLANGVTGDEARATALAGTADSETEERGDGDGATPDVLGAGAPALGASGTTAAVDLDVTAFGSTPVDLKLSVLVVNVTTSEAPPFSQPLQQILKHWCQVQVMLVVIPTFGPFLGV